jgi:glycosyltransferase involved in cell wall biosynthesis
MDMKVLWISDFNINNNPGGSQRTDEEVIQEGLKQGYQITRFNLQDPDDLLVAESYDIVVSNNLEHLRMRRPNVFEFIVSHPYHIRFEHDSNAYLTPEDRKLLFGSTKRTFFLSKYHHDMFVKLYGNIFHSVDIITSPIDLDKFKVIKAKEEREDATLYVGFLHFLKGTHNFFQHVMSNPFRQFYMASWGDKRLEQTARNFSNVTWLGTVAYENMPELLNRFTELYYHPAKFEPFCRSVGEAILCGMDLDVSDNIGAVHACNQHGVDTLRTMCGESKHKFWRLVKETL